MRTLARDSMGTVGRDTGGVCECGPLVGQRGFRMGEKLSKFFRKRVPFESKRLGHIPVERGLLYTNIACF